MQYNYRDADGSYEKIAEISEGDLSFEYRKYINSSSLKDKGGMYVIACIDKETYETLDKIYRRNDHMLMHSLPSFMDKCISKYRTFHEGKWEWDEEMQDWYDAKSCLYLNEIIRREEGK